MIVQYGSFGRKQLQTDLAGRLTEDGQWSYRLIALARKPDTQVDFAANVSTSDGKHVIGVPCFQANVDMEWDVTGVPGLCLDGLIICTGANSADARNSWRYRAGHA